MRLAECAPPAELDDADPPDWVEVAQVCSAVARAAAADCRSRSAVCWACTTACWACWRLPVGPPRPMAPAGWVDPVGLLDVDAAVSTTVDPVVAAAAVWAWLED